MVGNKTRDYITLLKKMLKEWKWLFGYIKNYKLIIFLYIVVGVIATAMSLGVSVASKYLIDAVVLHTDNVLLKYAVLVIGLSVFQYLFSALSFLLPRLDFSP